MLFSTHTHRVAQKFGLERAVEIIIEAGFPAIDVTMFDLNNGAYDDGYIELAHRLRKMADENGVVFNQAHAPFGGGEENYVNNLLPLFDKMFEFISILGVKIVVVHPLHGMRYYGNEEYLFNRNIEFYKSIGQKAKKYGIKIGIENMWQRHPITKHITDSLFGDHAELVRFYDTLDDSEAFTVCLDLGHVAICGREPEMAIRQIGKRLGCLHVQDSDYINDLHTLPGVGKINWDNVCHALADIDYQGELTLEADNFFVGFPDELWPTVSKFMADVTRELAQRIKKYKAEKQ